MGAPENPGPPEFDLFRELTAFQMLGAFAATGNEEYLKKAEALMNPKDVPCRVTADLRQYERLQDQAPEFDVRDEDQMRDCIGGELTKPVQALLESYEAMLASPNAVSREGLVSELRDLYEAVKTEWENL